MGVVEVHEARQNQPKPTPPEAGLRRRFALAALAALVSLMLSGCTETSPIAPLRFQETVGDQNYVTGGAITLVLPAASGGSGALRYTLSPTIPGLTFDAAERTLSGAPTEAGRHRMTYTVTDGKERVTLTFTITLEDDSPNGLTSRYRGRGDQVFVLNPEGESLDDALYTLNLGAASAEVYLIATNTAPTPWIPPSRGLRMALRRCRARSCRTSMRRRRDWRRAREWLNAGGSRISTTTRL